MPSPDQSIRTWLLSAAAILVLNLSGCASTATNGGETFPTRATLTSFALEGRFSLRQQNKNASGKLNWRHSGQNNALLLSSPLGQGIAEITADQYGARLTTQDGKTYAAPDVESLTQQVLDYRLPLKQLTDWVRGQGSADEIARLDAFGRLVQLRHEGWRIDYAYANDDPQAPPSRIFAENADGLELRLLVDEWNSLPAGEWKP